jgi:hypothetical protein
MLPAKRISPKAKLALMKFGLSITYHLLIRRPVTVHGLTVLVNRIIDERCIEGVGIEGLAENRGGKFQ